MSAVQVGYHASYLTSTAGVKWREEDWLSRAIIKGCKGEEFGGSVTATIGKQTKSFDKNNIQELSDAVVRTIGLRKLGEHVSGAISIVPIPNSGMVIGTEDDFPIVRLAKILAKAYPGGAIVEPVLRWSEPRVPVHRAGGFRNPEMFEEKLRLVRVPTRHVVVFDDMITSGSQMIAATRVLRDAGCYVLFGVSVGRTVNSQVEKPLGWHVEEFDCTRRRLNLEDFF